MKVSCWDLFNSAGSSADSNTDSFNKNRSWFVYRKSNIITKWDFKILRLLCRHCLTLPLCGRLEEETEFIDIELHMAVVQILIGNQALSYALFLKCPSVLVGLFFVLTPAMYKYAPLLKYPYIKWHFSSGTPSWSSILFIRVISCAFL